MKKIAIYILLLSCTTMFAQFEHYVQAKGGYGISTLQYDIKNGSSTEGMGMGAGLSYAIYYKDVWGFTTGLNYSTTTSKTLIPKYNSSAGIYTDNEGDDYTLLLSLDNWEEEQHIGFIEIPILFGFHRPFGKNTKALFGGPRKLGIYANAGIKYQTSLTSKYEVTSGTFETQGHYAHLDATFHNLPGRFEETDSYKPEGNIQFSNNIALTANAGLFYSLSPRWSIFGGAMVDYGWSDIKTQRSSVIVEADKAGDVSYNAILNSDQSSHISNFALRGEIGIRFKFGQESKKKRKEKEENTRIDTVTITETLYVEDTIILNDTLYVEKSLDSAFIDSLMHEYMEKIERVDARKVMIPQETITKEIAPIGMRIANENYLKYGFNSTQTGKDKLNMMAKYAQLINNHPEHTYTIIGHTCNTGTSLENKTLGMERAKNFLKDLTDFGVNPDHIILQSNGENTPLFSNDTEEGRARNRRVEIIINQKK